MTYRVWHLPGAGRWKWSVQART